jgi:thioredoxin-like negative regulator of GroEL
VAKVSNIEFFASAIEKDPDNTFARYSLAMEHRKSGDLATALATFNALIEHTPDYVAAYLMAAQVAVGLDDEDQAIDIINRGIEAAKAEKNDHAASELTDLLETLE